MEKEDKSKTSTSSSLTDIKIKKPLESDISGVNDKDDNTYSSINIEVSLDTADFNESNRPIKTKIMSKYSVTWHCLLVSCVLVLLVALISFSFEIHDGLMVKDAKFKWIKKKPFTPIVAICFDIFLLLISVSGLVV